MTTKIVYETTGPLNLTHRETLATAKRRVYGTEKVGFVRATEAEPADIVIDTDLLTRRPFPENYLTLTLANHANVLPLDWDTVLFLDIETHNAGKQWDMPIEEFFRMGQFAWGLTGEVVLTTDLSEVLAQMRAATTVVAHNGHSFDFSVLLGDEALHWTMQGRLFDTWVQASLVFPAPDVYTDRAGHTYRGAAAPSIAMKWFSLDNLGFQLGAGAKEGDLQSLAKKYNPKGTKVADLDYSLIPTDDPEFRAYGVQDVLLLREVFLALVRARPFEPYDIRCQKTAAIDAQMTRNGIAVDIPLARKRVADAAAKRDRLLADLQVKYDFPTVGLAPWSSKLGKVAILRALGDQGIFPEEIEGWPFGKTGPSLAGDVLIEHTVGTPAEEFGETLAQLKGQRPLAQQTLDYVKDDGRVHPSIVGIQRSGRRSVTKPGMTTWSTRGDKAFEKDYIVATPGHRLIEFDLSNADQRIVAALSGDPEYAKRFLPGSDGHEINGRIMYGDLYDTDPDFYRDRSKAPGHAWPYGAGVNRLVLTTGLPVEDIQRFVDGMAAAYPVLVKWQAKVRRAGDAGWIQNLWGRRMVIDKFYDHDWNEWRTRSWTQSPALHGQSGTTEVLYDGLLAMYEQDPQLLLWVVCTIHDAILTDPPVDQVDYMRTSVAACMETTINGIDFPVSSGPAGLTWHEAAH